MIERAPVHPVVLWLLEIAVKVVVIRCKLLNVGNLWVQGGGVASWV